MLRRRSRWILLALLLLLGGGVVLIQEDLDARHPEEKFQELIYVPSGVALKAIAFGFDAPMADVLWVRTLIYFSQNLHAVQVEQSKKAKYLYVYKLLDVITDLAPRFVRAYEMGGLFLTATGVPKEVRRGIQLFEKGLQAYERGRAEGVPISPDDAWRLHLYVALTYDIQLEDRKKAQEAYERAIRSPRCPAIIADTFEGFERQRRTGAGALQQYDSTIGIWENVLREAKGNADLQTYAKNRLEELYKSRALLHLASDSEKILTRAVRAWLKKTGRRTPPPDFTFQTLVDDGVLEALPPLPAEDPKTGKPDFPILLPDGEVHSNLLAREEALFRTDIFRDALEKFVHENKRRLPGRLELLLTHGYLDQLPVHPLRAVGFRFTYDPRTGSVGIFNPRQPPPED